MTGRSTSPGDIAAGAPALVSGRRSPAEPGARFGQATDLGPRDSWPAALATIAAAVAAAPQPMFVLWGPRRVILYNDAFVPLAGSRHPALFGRALFDAWPDPPAALRSAAEHAASGHAALVEEVGVDAEDRIGGGSRRFTLSCTPLADPATGQTGVLAILTDTTGGAGRDRTQEREAAFRAAVADTLRTATDPDGVLDAAAELVGRHLGADLAAFAQPGTEEAGARAVAAWSGSGDADSRAPDLLAAAVCAVGDLRAGRTVVVRGGADRAPGPLRTALADAGFGAVVAAPLLDDRHPGAGLVLASRTPRDWTPAEIAVVEEIAGRSWAAAGRLAAEARLRASEQRFRVALGSTPTVVFQHDRALRYTWIYNAPGDLTAAVGRTDEELLAPDDARRVTALKRQVLETGQPLRAELAIRHDGADHIYDMTLEPLKDSRGAVTGLTGSAYEISTLRATARSLAESEARYRAVFDNAAVGISHVGLDGRWLMVNDRMCEIMGYPCDELLAMSFQDITHPDDLGHDLDSLRRLRSGEIDSYSMEKRYLRKTGEVVWGHLSVGAVRAPEGEVTGFVSVVADVTERRRAMEAARESEERFRTMADHAPVIMWVADASGDCTYLNRPWSDHTGQRPEEGTGVGWLDCIHPEDREGLWTAYADARARRAPLRTEYRLRRADGGWSWVMDTAAPRLSDDGGFHGYIGSITDIDERHKAERHRQLLIDELNHRVKNTLAVIQVIARQTFGNGPQLRAFAGRITALSAAHDLLTRENWAQAGLADVVTETLRIADPDGSRTRVDGPPIVLSPKRAVTIALALHELATNAAKYGALSGETGVVTVTWSLAGDPPDRLTLCWEERGGPPVEPPARRGFGTRMIDEALALELIGVVDLSFRREGVTCRIEAPLDLPPDALG